MVTGNFYYINNDYYEKFQHCGLMGNKDEDEFGKHGRPCFYCFEQDGFYWMIPISSRIDKYKKLYTEKMERYNGKFDGIRFGFVNAQERAFLIQNACPVIDKYVESEYRIENDTRPVTIDKSLAKELNGIIRKVIRLYTSKGIKIILTDLDTILEGLYNELKTIE
ncbi:MAG: hypothetical protein II321_03210 [Lachnospiraceae bacterium]|nr:hypothetical protein [Lachnospiraceae bacterium]